MNSARLCSLAGRYDNPIPPRSLAPIDFKNSSSVILKKWKYKDDMSRTIYEPYRGVADSDAETAVVGVHHTDGGVRGTGEVQAVGAACDHLSHTTALRVLPSQHHCTPQQQSVDITQQHQNICPIHP